MSKGDLVIKNMEKVVIGVGVGKARERANFKDKFLPEVMKELALITGQQPRTRPAKKSIAGFKIREGDIVGLQVTLRKKRMTDFVSRIINIVLPRVRDFKGLDLKSIDEFGSLNIGFKDRQVFPEIDLDKSSVNFGLQVTFVPKIKDRAKAIDFYRSIGVPLRAVGQKTNA